MPTAHPIGNQPDGDALLRFVERFAIVLTEAGMARMPARVFAYILADDAERYTAADLASGLQVSPAAISGAVRQLVQGGFIGKEREPGTRRDLYRVYDDDVWYRIFQQRLPLLRRYEEELIQGLEQIGHEGRGSRRLRETLAFMVFWREEYVNAIERWNERKPELIARFETDRTTGDDTGAR